MVEPGGPESHDDRGPVVGTRREDRAPITARAREMSRGPQFALSAADLPVAAKVIRHSLVRTGSLPRRKAG
jgi:hypothetical protein